MATAYAVPSQAPLPPIHQYPQQQDLSQQLPDEAAAAIQAPFPNSMYRHGLPPVDSLGANGPPVPRHPANVAFSTTPLLPLPAFQAMGQRDANATTNPAHDLQARLAAVPFRPDYNAITAPTVQHQVLNRPPLWTTAEPTPSTTTTTSCSTPDNCSVDHGSADHNAADQAAIDQAHLDAVLEAVERGEGLLSVDGQDVIPFNSTCGYWNTATKPVMDKNGRFPCPFCPKTYLHAKHLKRHMVRLARPYMCVLCEEIFSRSDILKRHFQKCAIRRGNPTGATHLSEPAAHVKRNHPAFFRRFNRICRSPPRAFPARRQR